MTVYSTCNNEFVITWPEISVNTKNGVKLKHYSLKKNIHISDMKVSKSKKNTFQKVFSTCYIILEKFMLTKKQNLCH